MKRQTRREFGVVVGTALAVPALRAATAGAAPVPTAAEILQTAQAQAQTGTVSAEIALMLLDLQGERGVYADPKNLDELRTSLTRKLREHKTLRAFAVSEDVQPLLQFKR